MQQFEAAAQARQRPFDEGKGAQDMLVEVQFVAGGAHKDDRSANFDGQFDVNTDIREVISKFL